MVRSALHRACLTAPRPGRPTCRIRMFGCISVRPSRWRDNTLLHDHPARPTRSAARPGRLHGGTRMHGLPTRCIRILARFLVRPCHTRGNTHVQGHPVRHARARMRFLLAQPPAGRSATSESPHVPDDRGCPARLAISGESLPPRQSSTLGVSLHRGRVYAAGRRGGFPGTASRSVLTGADAHVRGVHAHTRHAHTGRYSMAHRVRGMLAHTRRARAGCHSVAYPICGMHAHTVAHTATATGYTKFPPSPGKVGRGLGVPSARGAQSCAGPPAPRSA